MSFCVNRIWIRGVCQANVFSRGQIRAILGSMKRVELYRTEERDREALRAKRAKTAMLAVGAAGLVICTALCCFASRKTVAVLRPVVIGVSILSGWIVIFLSHTVYAEAKAAHKHDALMLSEPRTTVTGSFEKTDDVRRVKNGVTVRKVRLQNASRDVLLNISEEKAALLPDAFSGTAETVYDFIAAYEADGDD